MLEIREDGSYVMDQEYFSYRSKKQMWSSRMESLLGEPRNEGEDLTRRHKDIAATLQEVLEEVLLKQTEHLYEVTDTENLCMAGGVALNSAANGKLRQKSPFDNIWIQPAAGDDGGAMGAALERSDSEYRMEDVYLGPEYGKNSVKSALEDADAAYDEKSREKLVEEAAERLADGEVVSVFQGRLEWGPRALGNRSILADPRREDMVDRVNEKVKFRESFRPFARPC